MDVASTPFFAAFFRPWAQAVPTFIGHITASNQVIPTSRTDREPGRIIRIRILFDQKGMDPALWSARRGAHSTLPPPVVGAYRWTRQFYGQSRPQRQARQAAERPACLAQRPRVWKLPQRHVPEVRSWHDRFTRNVRA